MKKYLFGALALPLLFACSSDDLFEKEAVSNDQFAGIEKVDATFYMDEDESGTTRMNTAWGAQVDDRFGFAWLTDKYAAKDDGDVKINIDGNAYQNHPLDVVRHETRGLIFQPQTSIYVGKYYIYYPYDETVVDYGPINFTTLMAQPMAEADVNDMNPAVKALAKNAIIIGDKWTEVTPDGWLDAADNRWDKAGIDKPIKLYPAIFSNKTALDLKYTDNKPTFAAKKAISGATDISYEIAAGTAVQAADIYGATIDLQTGGASVAANSFTYAPTTEPMTTAGAAAHSGTFWADKSNLGTAGYTGFTFTKGEIALETDAAGISTDEKSSGFFWFNSLPVVDGDGALATTKPIVKIETSYGRVTINDKALGDCAYVYDKFDGVATSANEWIKLAAADDAAATPNKTWNFGAHNTFVNHYGNHTGKYAFDVDFKTADMTDMHIKNDAHLQKALMFYLASGKTAPYTWYLDADEEDNTFKLSKISIALIQSIAGNKVKVRACETHCIQDPVVTPAKIIITQDGSAGKTAVPNLDKVFAAATDVYLSSDCTWTWAGGEDGKTALAIDANVSSITNEGTLTVNASNIELSEAAATLGNAAGATMNITKVTTVKNALTNLGIINVGSATDSAPELRAYGVAITNDATGLKDATETEPAQYGIINNYGVVGVTAGVAGGEFNNYGYIAMIGNGAITLLSSNELVDDFDKHFAAADNKMGVVELPEGNPYALVSVHNAAETGFIKYNWTEATYTHDEGNVKYNTLVVNRPDNGKIEFTGDAATEIKYIEFKGIRTQVVNPTAANKLTALKGIYVHPGKSIIIEKNNQIVCSDGAYLGANATVYKGGIFTHNAAVAGTTASNYFGDWYTTQIVEY